MGAFYERYVERYPAEAASFVLFVASDGDWMGRCDTTGRVAYSYLGFKLAMDAARVRNGPGLFDMNVEFLS